MTPRFLSLALLLTSLGAAAVVSGCSDPGPVMGTGGAPSSGGSTGSGGEAPGSGGTTADPTVPTDISQAGIEAFLAAGSYKSAPWVFDSAIREVGPGGHGRVRVYYNPTTVESIAAGNNDINADPGNPVDSMAVKELYDSSDTQIGTAVMLRTGLAGTQSDWLYYCASTDQAACEDTTPGPIYNNGGQCRFCHGGTFIAEMVP